MEYIQCPPNRASHQAPPIHRLSMLCQEPSPVSWSPWAWPFLELPLTVTSPGDPLRTLLKHTARGDGSVGQHTAAKLERQSCPGLP